MKGTDLAEATQNYEPPHLLLYVQHSCQPEDMFKGLVQNRLYRFYRFCTSSGRGETATEIGPPVQKFGIWTRYLLILGATLLLYG